MDFFKELLPKCCDPTYPMHGTGPSRKLSNIPYLRPMMVLPVLVGTSGNVTVGTHMPERADHCPDRVREGLRFLHQRERFAAALVPPLVCALARAIQQSLE